PWLLLATLEASYLALLGAASAWISPVVDRARWAWPAVTGLLWVAQEALRGRTPFGGFPWGRLAFSQGDAPTLRFAAVGGAPLVTFAVAVTGGLLAVAVWHACQRSSPRTWRRFWRFSWWRSGWRSGWRWSRTLAPLLGAAALPAAGLLIPVGASASGTATVAIVQGNVPRLGLDFNA